MSIVRPRIENIRQMKASRIFLSAASVLVLASPALAQQMYPGQGVAVNPAATGSTGTVVYRGGTYVRLPPLLQPGQPYPGQPDQPIVLHMPEAHRTVVRRQTEPQQEIATAPASPPPPPPPRPASHAVPQSPPPLADTSAETTTGTTSDSATTIPFSFGGAPPAQQSRTPDKHSALPPTHASVPTPERTASVAPQPAATGQSSMTPGEEGPDLSKRSEIIFPHNGTDPTAQSMSDMKQLAGTLNSALNAGARRVQLDAFGGAPGDKSSDARRVSLKRALVIRQLLIDDGVPASRIDVRAMGGIDDNGNADRVDVYVRAG